MITGSKDSKVILWNLLRIGNEIRAEDEKDGPSEMVVLINVNKNSYHIVDIKSKLMILAGVRMLISYLSQQIKTT